MLSHSFFILSSALNPPQPGCADVNIFNIAHTHITHHHTAFNMKVVVYVRETGLDLAEVTERSLY